MSAKKPSIQIGIVQIISIIGLLIAPRAAAAEYTQSMDGQGFVFTLTEDPNSMSGTFNNSWGPGLHLDPAGTMFFPSGELHFAGGLGDTRRGVPTGTVGVGFGLQPFYDGSPVIDFDSPNPFTVKLGISVGGTYFNGLTFEQMQTIDEVVGDFRYQGSLSYSCAFFDYGNFGAGSFSFTRTPVADAQPVPETLPSGSLAALAIVGFVLHSITGRIRLR
jgi:hypothetical protein